MAHCGFPEAAFQRYANILIDKGFKIARIEQVETPKMMEQRCKKMTRKVTKFDKVVERKICEKVYKSIMNLFSCPSSNFCADLDWNENLF